MAAFELTDQQIAQFDADGYFAVPGLFTTEEVEIVRRIAEAKQLMARGVTRDDGEGGRSAIWLETELKADVYGAFAHSPRIVGPMKQLLRDDLLHYHHKMMMKEPHVGGAWIWHQDYGYWYGDGFLFPHMASCMIAVDQATKENGCLQVLRGSHRIGRINHGPVGDQTGADVERVELIANVLDLVYCQLEPGTALFFDSNTLHRSDQNRSDKPRWSFICCYTAASNPSHLMHIHSKTRCTPVEQSSEDRVLDIGRRQLEAIEAGS